MRKDIFRSVLVVGGICSAVLLGGLAVDAKTAPISASVHWAKGYVSQLAEVAPNAQSWQVEQFNEPIPLPKLEQLVQELVSAESQVSFTQQSREAVVAELIQLWAQETNQNIDEMVIPMVLVYQDTMEMDETYRHLVMVAHFNGLIQGRGDSIFAPKDQVTYGEAAVLVTNLQEMLSDEDKDGEKLNTGLSTTGEWTKSDGQLVFDFQFTNNQDQVQELVFRSGQQYEIEIIDQEGQEVYRYSKGRAFTMALIMSSLEPGESMEWSETWDMTDMEGELVPAGKYQVVITTVAQDKDMKPLPREAVKCELEITI